MSSCGDNTSGSVQQTITPPPAPDFSIALDVTSLSLPPGGAGVISVSIKPTNASTSTLQVSVAINGLPAQVTAMPASFTLKANAAQKVTILAGPAATLGTATVTVAGNSGSLQHSMPLNLQIGPAPTGAYAPFRFRYLDAGQILPVDADRDNLRFPNFHMFYHQPTRRFFSADSPQNRILVYDAASQTLIREITLPGAWSIDESPDGTTLWVGTQNFDIYKVDPVAMTVTERVPAQMIGANGYSPYQVNPLADGRFALLGDPLFDLLTGYSFGSFAIWDRSSNSLTTYKPGSPSNSTCGRIAFQMVTPDRTKLMFGSNLSDLKVCQFDTSSGQIRDITAQGGTRILVPADGKEFITYGGATEMYVYGMATMQLLDHFPAQNAGGTLPGYVLSRDGNTLYAVNNGTVAAYDWRAHQQLGWSSAPKFQGIDMNPLVVDETGLVAGLLGLGAAFADVSSLQTSARPQLAGYAGLNPSPNVGPAAGGTRIEISGGSPNSVQHIFFGSQSAAQATDGTVLSPEHASGAVDIVRQDTTGFLAGAFQAFSYGPTISKVLENLIPAEGGAEMTIVGYGLIPYNFGFDTTGLQAFVNGQQASITGYDFVYHTLPHPLPLQAIQVLVPAGTAGNSADITVFNSAGAGTASNAVTYLPATQYFPLSGAQLVQGIYDPKRDLYYFTNMTEVEVFSRAQGKWLSPIPIAKFSTTAPQRLFGIALSQDASKLAVSDNVSGTIYVLNPESPASIRAFPGITNPPASAKPSGLAISNTGIVYFTGPDGNFPASLWKLDTNTGQSTSHLLLSAGYPNADVYNRVLMSADNQRVYLATSNSTGYVFETATDTLIPIPNVSVDYVELALSADQSTIGLGQALLDGDLKLLALADVSLLDSYDESFVSGEKLSANGRLLFQPLQNGILIADAHTGRTLSRVSLPFILSSQFDALVSDGRDNALIVLVGGTGSGIAIVDLSSISDPIPVLPATNSTSVFGSRIFLQSVNGTEATPPIMPTRQRRYVTTAALGSIQSAAGLTNNSVNANLATSPLVLAGIDQRGFQSINFSPIPSAQFGDSVNLTASASSGLPVSFVSTTPNVCTTSGTIAAMVGVGTCFLEARQAGDDNYTAAVGLQSFTVNRASQTIAFTAIPSDGTYGSAGPYRLFATASSGLPVSFRVTGPASINGSTLTVTGKGTVAVTASQSGGLNYRAAAPVSQTIIIYAPTQNDILHAIPHK